MPSYLILLNLWPSKNVAMSIKTGTIPELKISKIIGLMYNEIISDIKLCYPIRFVM